MNLQTNFFACCKNESGDELHLGSSCRRLELFPEFLDNGEADPRCCHQVHCVYCGHCDDADASIVLFLFHININHSTSDTSSTLKWNYQDWHLQIPVGFQVYWLKIFRDLRQNIFMKVAAAGGDGAPRMWPAGRTRSRGVTGLHRQVTKTGGFEAEKHGPMPPAVTRGKCRVLTCGISVLQWINVFFRFLSFPTTYILKIVKTFNMEPRVKGWFLHFLFVIQLQNYIHLITAM